MALQKRKSLLCTEFPIHIWKHCIQLVFNDNNLKIMGNIKRNFLQFFAGIMIALLLMGLSCVKIYAGQSATLLYETSKGEVLAEKRLNCPDEIEQLCCLLSDGSDLRDRYGQIIKRGGGAILRITVADEEGVSRSYTVYRAVPESLGREVMVIREESGRKRYQEPEKFENLVLLTEYHRSKRCPQTGAEQGLLVREIN